MKRIIFLSICLLSINFAFAQEEKTDSIPDGWSKTGNVALTLNQAAFNNEWAGGGVSNIAINALVNYDFNLKRGDIVWDNKIILDYGAYKNKGDDNFTKSNDRIEFNSILGKEAKGYWYYSAFFNFKTQFDTGFGTETVDIGLTNSDGTPVLQDGVQLTQSQEVIIKESHFFSPAVFQAGPGLLWKKSDNLNVNISPAAAKVIIVHDEYAGTFGTDPGKTSAFELGASIRGYYKFDLLKNVSMENLLSLYSNYLDKPQNIDIDYTLNLVMTINKYLSTNLTFQAIYDDNIEKGFQIRETLGVGVNYTF